jgi:hypothetical protein
MTTDITTITAAHIARIETPGEAAKLSRVAKAASIFYQAQDDRQASQQAKAVYIRAAVRAGELLLDTPRENGGRKTRNSNTHVTPYQEALDGAGITRHTAQVWQRLAEIPCTVLEAYFIDPKYQMTEYTFIDLLKYAKAPGGGLVITLDSIMNKIVRLIRYALDCWPDEAPELLRAVIEREL